MKLWKYKIFNVTLQKYYSKEYFYIEDLTRDFVIYQRSLGQYQLEVHKIEVASIALIIENE